MLSIFGSGIGRGISIGPAYVLKNSEIEVPQFKVNDDDIEAEIARFEEAVATTARQYDDILAALPADAPKESAAFLEAHKMMLQDPLLVQETINIIKTEKSNAEQALDTQAGRLIKVFEQMQGTYLKNKKTDVRHITNRLLRSLMGIVSHTMEELSETDLSRKIVIGKDLSPAEAMLIKERKAVAFATDLGSQISHTSIVARSLKLPAVVGLHGSTQLIEDNDTVIVDGMRGIVLIDPSATILKEYRALQRAIRAREAKLNTLIKRASKTRDGQKVILSANIETIGELREVKRVNAAGVGLYRTEYLFMNRESPPSEEEQFKAYQRIVTRLKKPIVIRTLDVGGDKKMDFDYPKKRSSESPLGLRAVRLCLDNVGLFKPQLRAILRVSALGRVALMVPMLSNIDETLQVLTLIKQVKKELRNEGIAFDNRIKIGGMIEVPGAAIAAEQFAQHLDFLSIGTNDLIQYTLAIDRVDDAVNYLYDPTHPAVLHLIKHVIDAGARQNVPVSLCGEMSANPNYTKLLIGLGLRHLSMDATYLLDIKERVLNSDSELLHRLAPQVLQASTPREARARLDELNLAS